MIFCLLAEIVLSVLAVFGLYVLMHLLLGDKRVTVALEIGKETDPADVPGLLLRARESYFLPGCERVVALVDCDCANDTALLFALEEGEADIYIVKKE